MLLNRKSVELLAPAGTWDALVAAVEAGADAVYLGGKCFNMRMHRSDVNFSDEALAEAVEYAHAHGVKLYVTLNNLISSGELPRLREYLLYLEKIRPDAILVQDLAVLQLKRELGLTVPLHASVMMNTHNEPAVELLKEYGITRVVVSREMTLSELSLLKERTGVEVEYFMHGDMCMAESGQCIHSGVLFGQSSNRGRCLKPCRWAFELIDEKTGESLDASSPGPHKLAIKDMCMYRSIPELIQAGVSSFKIEGRMRPADFVRRIVATYRRAIDAYISDPCGYQTPEADWAELYAGRVRDYTTTFAFGQPSAQAIGFSGEREPRFFSEPVKEASLADDAILRAEAPINKRNEKRRCLSVRCRTVEAARAAVDNGADTIYIGGEAFLPDRPWRLEDYRGIIRYAHERGVRVVISTLRSTMRRECGELEQFLPQAAELGADGIMVSNPGSLRLARQLTELPIQTDISFNIFNKEAVEFLRQQGAVMAASSYEMSFAQLRQLVEASPLPIETVVHGTYESMLCDHNIAAMSLPHYDFLDNPEIMARHYALRDRAGEVHALRTDQLGRTHINFARDLCYYPYLDKLNGLGSYRIEAQDYPPELTGALTRAYRAALDALSAGERPADIVAELEAKSPRGFGIGTFRFRESRDSI